VISDAEALDLVEGMVGIPSVSYDEAAVAAWTVEAMGRLGFEARVDEAGNVVGTIGQGPTTGVLLGHIDTVPGHIPVRRAGGRLFGRGSVDAKGCLATFIAAAARAARSGRLRHHVIVIGCVEEEVPSSRGARHVAPRLRPDWCVVGEPSGWDAITLGYKGFLAADVSFEGPNAHTAHDYPTACELACSAWSLLSSHAQAYNANRPRLFDRLLPALIHMDSGRDGLKQRARLRVSLRLPPDLPPADAEALLATLLPHAEITTEGGIPAWSGPRTTPLHRRFLAALRAHTDHPRSLLKTGTADLNIVAPAWGCPALAYGPGDAALDHGPDEHLVLDEYLKAIAVMEDVLAMA
jgi:LysW-gamma-L-lysine carboxypeptidase